MAKTLLNRKFVESLAAQGVAGDQAEQILLDRFGTGFTEGGRAEFESLLQAGKPVAPPQPFQAPTDVDVPESIKVSDLQSTKEPNLGTPKDISDPSGFVSSLQVQGLQDILKEGDAITSPVQQESQVLQDQFIESLRGLSGQGERLTELEQQAGVPGAQAQLQDLNLQIAQLKGEFDKAIQAVPSKRRGVALSLVEGEQALLQRQQAAEIGALSSVAQAVQGNIQLAQQTAERAVAIEFAAKEQELAVLQQQLDFNRDKMTAAEKRRADLLQVRLTERQEQINTEKEERQDIVGLALAAAEAGDAQAAQAILRAKTFDEAFGLGSEFLATGTDELLSIADAQQLGLPFGTTVGQAASLGIVPTDQISAKDILDLNLKALQIEKAKAELAKDQSGLDSKTQTFVDNLAKQFDSNQIVKDFVNVQNKKISVDEMVVPGEESGPVDLALVFEFMKSLDPTSVVRESEFASAAKSGSIFKGAFAKFNGAFTDGTFLPEEVKEEFKRITNIKFDAKKTQYSNLQSEFSRRINDRTGRDDGQNFLTEYNFELFGADDQQQPFTSLDDVVERATLEQRQVMDTLMRENDLTPEEAISIFNEASGFNQDQVTSQNLSRVTAIPNDARVNTSIGVGKAANLNPNKAGFGSPWKVGFDFILDGGRNARATTPVSGTVVSVVNDFSNPGKGLGKAGNKQNHGFGNQVVIRLADGRELLINHLEDAANLKPGQKINKGDFVGIQGNTGFTFGSDSVHLDLSLKKPDAPAVSFNQKDYFPASHIAALMNTTKLA